MTGIRRVLTVLVTVASLAALASAPALAIPTVISATGDSITQAYDSCGTLLVSCPENSWSTGTEAAVRSIYLRLKATHTEIEGNLFNDSVVGAKVEGIEAQLGQTTEQLATYITIEIGANDACTATVEAMTPKATFAERIESALNNVARQHPTTRILVASIPNVYQLWSLLKNNASARFIWNFGSICQSLLREPLATTEEAELRRNSVRRRVIEYNEALRRACAAHEDCVYDGNRTFEFAFEAGEVSNLDYFHPSQRGQATLARIEWEISGW